MRFADSCTPRTRVKDALRRFWRWLFGCPHARTTWPRIATKQPGPAPSNAAIAVGQQYVTCLECGKEIPYSQIRFARKPSRYEGGA